MQSVSANNSQYASLFKPESVTHPIFYFGNPQTAEIATCGVNPSATEFVPGRWPRHLTDAQLDARCLDYFSGNVPPHNWFDGYEDPINGGKALNILGRSYRTDAVHLDLSPRATISMGRVSNSKTLRPLFLKMLADDMQWFLLWLAHCPNLKAAIMAGTVTKAHYFDEFLSKHLPSGYSLRVEASNGSCRGATKLYTLAGPRFELPVLFCRKSPSDRKDKGALLASEVNSMLPQLKRLGF